MKIEDSLLSIADRIIRTKRRNIALIVRKDASLEIRAPFQASLGFISGIIEKNIEWIKKKKELINAKRLSLLPRQFVAGESFLYQGASYPLQVTNDDAIILTNTLCFPQKLLLQPRDHLTVWYKNRALETLSMRVEYYSKLMGLQCANIKISNAESRWGSCSPKGVINFSWKLIMAPLAVLDYVVVHELAHMLERGHNKIFWGHVRNILPNYKEQETWLKQHGHTLFF